MAAYRILKQTLGPQHTNKPYKVQRKLLGFWIDCELGDEYTAEFKTIGEAEGYIKGERGSYQVVKTIE